ncbi:hypothetical protein Patl1_15531 [Pistacia atlantica]|uniref:Uncharacterized protein n=1 Tax=Pistacia atlantica TaxID=434234 RepID=A0ACC1B8Z4_9ROSI|nr:hypothetical protein Patl1_15531 [Pistacia atlantica]
MQFFVDLRYLLPPLMNLIILALLKSHLQSCLPPPLFWVVYFVIIISFPWHGMLWNLLKYIFKWFVISLQSCSTLVITCSTLQQEATPAPGIAVEFVDTEGNPMQNLASREHDAMTL